MQLPLCFGSAPTTSTPSPGSTRSSQVPGYKKRWKSVLALACALAVFDVPAHAADAAWTIKDLGALGATSSGASGINNSGQVTGSSALPGGNISHAYVYKDGVMTDISASPDWVNFGRGINNSGQVVGSMATSSGFPREYFPFLYKDGVMQMIGYRSGEATAINNAGAFTGTVQAEYQQPKAFIYQNGAMTIIGTAGEEFSKYSFGAAINDAGQVAGTGVNAQNTRHAFLYSNGRMIDLSPPGGYSAAFGINNAGQVVGENMFPTNSSIHAFLYSGGSMQDLGTLGGSYSRAYDINNSGMVVGVSSTTGEQENLPFLYAQGKMISIRDLPGVKDSGWILSTTGLAINDAGQIAGTGIKDGQWRAFLISPP